MSITMEQANELIKLVNSEAELRNLVSQLDVSASGSVTILYGGRLSNGVHSTNIVTNLIENGQDIRVLDNIEASKFLDFDTNPTFRDATKNRTGI